jgi:hypothetical protein
MRVYTNKKVLSEYKIDGWEFEILNELKDTTNHRDDNCLYHTRFLFEMDKLPLDEQIKIATKLQKLLVRVVYSGSKSLHCIIEFSKDYENDCAKYYKEIWKVINETYFNGNCDTQCVNPSRLTRTPDVLRADTNKIQEMLYNNPGNWFSDAKKVIRDARAIQQMYVVKNALRQPVRANTGKQNNGMCINYDVIKHYLNTPYLKMTGNGDSSISLFKAILCCIKYKDNDTLQEVLTKARNEHWSETELNHKIEDAKKRV